MAGPLNISSGSVLKQMREIAGRDISGNRKTYYASPDFISYNSLLMNRDATGITRLSISDVKTIRLPGEAEITFPLISSFREVAISESYFTTII